LIYYDSSALLKLIHQERESVDFMRWYEARQEVDATSSSLVLVEVIRAARRQGAGAERKARAILNGLDLMPMSRQLLNQAAVLPFEVRSLDAIHLASAIQLGGALDVFVAYDKRLLVAAEQAGLPVESPGAA
jgi:uncharacterized protein